MSLIKKENICISEEYTGRDGQQKKLWKTIGEIITLEGSNGVFQKIKLWGPGGFTEASVLAPRDQQEQASSQPKSSGFDDLEEPPF